MDRKTLDTRLDIKFANTSDVTDKSFTGYGAFFNNIDSYGDVIAPGAFAKTLAEFNGAAQLPAMLWNHDSMAMPIGVWLDISEDAQGLKVSGQFLNTATGSDAYTLAKTGAVSGLSIGYIVTGFEMSSVNGQSIRTITEIRLFEISLVTFPANDLARVQSVKNQENEMNNEEMKTALGEMMAEIKALHAKIDIMTVDQKSTDDDSDEDCDCEDDADCECDDEEKSEAKYNTAFIEAVNNLTLKLAKEMHGR